MTGVQTCALPISEVEPEEDVNEQDFEFGFDIHNKKEHKLAKITPSVKIVQDSNNKNKFPVIEEHLEEGGQLDKYLLSRGINPGSLSTQTKISHSKSSEFTNWKNRQVQEDTKSLIHKIKSNYHKKKTDKAFDKGDEDSFAKHSDLSTYHHIKSGGKPPEQVDEIGRAHV